ncbi:MAG: DUF6868 family protein, partial [Gammaproteobacteria bacterium]
INFVLLLLWSLATFAAHDAIYSLSAHFFPVSVETFDAINFAGIVAYKIGVLFFNVVPFIALVIVTRSRARGT